MGCAASTSEGTEASRSVPVTSFSTIATQTTEANRCTTPPLPAKESTCTTADSRVTSDVKRVVGVDKERWVVKVQQSKGYPSFVPLLSDWSDQLSNFKNDGHSPVPRVNVSMKTVQEEADCGVIASDEEKAQGSANPLQAPKTENDDEGSNYSDSGSFKLDDPAESAPKATEKAPKCEPEAQVCSILLDDSFVKSRGLVVVEYCDNGHDAPQLCWAQMHRLLDLIAESFTPDTSQLVQLQNVSTPLQDTLPQEDCGASPMGSPAMLKSKELHAASPESPSRPRARSVMSPLLYSPPGKEGRSASIGCQYSPAGSPVSKNPNALSEKEEELSPITGPTASPADGSSSDVNEVALREEAAQWNLIDTLWSPAFKDSRLSLMEDHLVAAPVKKASSHKSKEGSSGSVADGWCTPSLSLVSAQAAAAPETPERFLTFYFTPSVVLPRATKDIMNVDTADGRSFNEGMGATNRWLVTLSIHTAEVMEESSTEPMSTTDGDAASNASETSSTGHGSQSGSQSSATPIALTIEASWNPSTHLYEANLSYNALQRLVYGDANDAVNDDSILKNAWNACIRGEHSWAVMERGSDTSSAAVYTSDIHTWIAQVGLLHVPGTVAMHNDQTVRLVDPIEKAELSVLERCMAQVLIPDISTEDVRGIRKRVKEARRLNKAASVAAPPEQVSEPATPASCGPASLGMHLPDDSAINKRFPEYAGTLRIQTPADAQAEQDEKAAPTAARLARCPVLSPGVQQLRIAVHFSGSQTDGLFAVPNPGGASAYQLNVQQKLQLVFHYRFYSAQNQALPQESTSWMSLPLEPLATTEEFGFIGKVTKTVYRSYEGYLSLGAIQWANLAKAAEGNINSGTLLSLLEDGLLDYRFTLSSEAESSDGESGQQVHVGFVSGAGDASSVSAAAQPTEPDTSAATRSLYVLSAAYPMLN